MALCFSCCKFREHLGNEPSLPQPHSGGNVNLGVRGREGAFATDCAMAFSSSTGDQSAAMLIQRGEEGAGEDEKQGKALAAEIAVPVEEPSR